MHVVSFIHSTVTMVTASKDFGQELTKNSLKLSFFVLLVLSKIAFICPKNTLFVEKQTLINKIKF